MVYLSLNVYMNWHVYFDLQWELVLFLSDTIQWLLGIWLQQNWELNDEILISIYAKSN